MADQSFNLQGPLDELNRKKGTATPPPTMTAPPPSRTSGGFDVEGPLRTLDQGKVTAAPAATSAPAPTPAPGTVSTPWWNTSIIKSLTGKNPSEWLDPAFDVVRENLEKHIPEKWKASLPGQYVTETMKELAHTPGGVADMLTKPWGVPIIVAQFTPVGPYVDMALAGVQGVSAAADIFQAGKETVQQGHPSPQTFAQAAVGTAMAFGLVKYGKRTADLIRNSGQAFTDTQKLARMKPAIQYLAGTSDYQKLKTFAEGLINEKQARAHVEYNQAVHQVADSYLHVEALSEEDKIDSMFNLETAGMKTKTAKDPATGRITVGIRNPAKQKSKEIERAGELITNAIDQKWERILNKGISSAAAQEHFDTNYMARFFKKYQNASDTILNLYKTRPTPGHQTFRNKRRILGPIKDLIDPTSPNYKPDMELVTNNWVHLGLMKLHELNKFEIALDLSRELKQQGAIKAIKDMRNVPVDASGKPWRKIEDRVIPKSEIPTGRFLVAPEPIAITLNRWTSPSLQWSLAKEGLKGRAAAKILNGVKEFNNVSSHLLVSGSLFHPMLSASLSMTNSIALAPMWASRARWLKAGEAMAKAFIAPVEDYMKGDKTISHARDPLQHPEAKPWLEMLIQGGGRASMDTEARSVIIDKFFARSKAAAIRSGSPLKGQFWNFMENANNWVMRNFVPRLKIGAFLRLAEYELDRIGPNASIAERREAFGRAYRSIENRHGQFTYDNWNVPGYIKGAGFLGVQFLGWTVGTMSEIGGGVLDLPRGLIARPLAGEKPVLTHRAAWTLMGFPVGMAMLNAIAHYYNTGERPKELKDFMFPKTGRKNADGTDERWVYPWAAYARTSQQFIEDPAQALLSRASNTIVDLYSMSIKNADYNDKELWKRGDPVLNNIAREAMFVGGRMVPLSVQTIFDETQGLEETGAKGLVTGAMGIRRAPAAQMRTAGENAVLRYAAKHYQRGPFSEEEFDKKSESRLLADKYAQGTATQQDIADAASSRQITAQDAEKILLRHDLPKWHPRGSYGSQFIGLQADEMLRVWREANDDEKSQIANFLFPYIDRKIAGLPDKEQEKVMKDYQMLVDEWTEKQMSRPPEARQ